MLLADSLSPDAFRQRVKIYATDVDEDALTEARAATYDAKAVESVPANLLERYFDRLNGRYIINKDLRRSVIFGRNDLVKDAPISRVDLLVCRNTLMYMNAETQRNVVSKLHFALAPEGVVFLGHAEMLLSHSDRFTPLSLKQRIFRKAPGSHSGLERYDPAATIFERQGDLSTLMTVRELAFRASPVAQIVVTGEDTVAMVNQQAELLFGLSTRDVGRLLRDLEVSYRPIELRAYLEQAKVERRSTRIPDVEWARPGSETVWFEIHVNPLVDSENALLGVSVVFFDVTATRALLDKVVHTNRQLEAAYEELQSTNEELETTNEELQSTVEELETTNEELQSTNEELETMNEELQSTNDELHAINDALGERSEELDQAHAFLDSVIYSVHLGMVVVDREMRVVVWNRGCEELWGLRAEETTGNCADQPGHRPADGRCPAADRPRLRRPGQSRRSGYRGRQQARPFHSDPVVVHSFSIIAERQRQRSTSVDGSAVLTGYSVSCLLFEGGSVVQVRGRPMHFGRILMSPDAGVIGPHAPPARAWLRVAGAPRRRRGAASRRPGGRVWTVHATPGHAVEHASRSRRSRADRPRSA